MRLEGKDVAQQREIKVGFGIGDWGIHTLTIL